MSKITAMYIRLSMEDEDVSLNRKEESNSVSSQRELLNHYMLEGTNGRTTVRGDRMSLTTLPNAKPSLGEASIVGHGPMSVIIGYRITDDGGETITETGGRLAGASENRTATT